MIKQHIKENVIHETVSKKSTFITYLFLCDDDLQATHYIKQVKSQHPKANHHCTAFISKDGLIERFDDDGEPTHTAGKPMLLVLSQHNIHRVLAITVRYFGGTLLGKGGLVKAYTNSIIEALKQTELVTPQAVFVASISLPLHHSPLVESYLYKHVTITKKQYTDHQALLSFRTEPNQTLKQTIDELSKGTAIWLNQEIIYE